MVNAYLKEIFESIQGEALYIGQKQIFIRFCGCNLKCDYCDTDFSKDKEFCVHDLNKSFKNPISAENLKNIVENFSAETISLTGGEPLLQTEFLQEFLPLVKNKNIYLETNGILADELSKIISLVHIVSMDIKLQCSTNQPAQFADNKKFIEIAKRANKEIFAKIVLNKNYLKEELLTAIELVKKFNIPLVLQPMDCKDKSLELDKNGIIELCKFATENYTNIRFIPQMHKFIGLL